MFDQPDGVSPVSLNAAGHRERHAGFTLVQLMIGVVVGLIVLAGAIALFSTLRGAGTEANRQMRLTYHLREALDLMTREARRCGYWSQARFSQLPTGALTPAATSGSSVGFAATATLFSPAAESEGYYLAGNSGVARVTRWLSTSQVEGDVVTAFASTASIAGGSWVWRMNPFTLGGNDLAVQEGGACLTYSYDVNGDTVVDDTERFGFRLRDGAVQMRIGGSGPSTCTDGTWEPVTDPALTVTALAFQVSSVSIDLDGAGPASARLDERRLTINIAGRDATDPDVQLGLQQTLRLRNDVLRP